MNTKETVLITGASSGIGLELAKLFAADGSTVVLTARRRDLMDALAGDLRERYKADVHVVVADLGQPSAPGELCRALDEQGLRVDVLVNNAGFGGRGPFVEQDPQRQVEMIGVNITALTRLTRMLLPGMLERRRGGVLNVGSIAGFQPGPNMALYYATKAYVLSLTEALAEEVKGRGVTISCLAPGPTRTEFGRVADMDETPAFKYVAATADEVARIGYRGFRRGKVLVIPGTVNNLATFSVRFAPRSAARKLAGWLQK